VVLRVRVFSIFDEARQVATYLTEAVSGSQASGWMPAWSTFPSREGAWITERLHCSAGSRCPKKTTRSLIFGFV